MVQRPGHCRARARIRARPHGDALILGPLDEVGHDQEVAGKAHPCDDLDLEFEPALVFEHSRRKSPRLESAAKEASASASASAEAKCSASAIRRGKSRGNRAPAARTSPPGPESSA